MHNVVIVTKVLWLGHPECRASWVLESSLRRKLVENYENGVATEITNTTENILGNICNILTSQTKAGTPEPKRARKSYDFDKG
jgi:hypothetical protein